MNSSIISYLLNEDCPTPSVKTFHILKEFGSEIGWLRDSSTIYPIALRNVLILWTTSLWDYKNPSFKNDILVALNKGE